MYTILTTIITYHIYVIIIIHCIYIRVIIYHKYVREFTIFLTMVRTDPRVLRALNAVVIVVFSKLLLIGMPHNLLLLVRPCQWW